MDATLKRIVEQRELERERTLTETKFRRPRCTCGAPLKGAAARLPADEGVCGKCKAKR